ncbi:uncharacterized protein [Oscarella lobularis]|uniref:uncharacterized protein n=1 Tax=Oscarella lobularis TaxID=121494 RepID=UPI0033144692
MQFRDDAATTIWRGMSDNSLRLDDDSILRWDPPWGNSSQDIVYLPFIAKAGSPKWKPLETQLETTVDIRRLVDELECDTDYEFRVDAYGKNGTQYTRVKYNKTRNSYQKDL